MKLNLGCGRNIKSGWVNLDRAPCDGVDVVADLDRCRIERLPFENDSVEEFLLSHVLEHVSDSLALMEELHRIAAPDALMTIRVPYGSSDGAWEDLTHVRPYFLGSFGYFGQPFYWRADYGYRGDWRCNDIYLAIDDRFRGNDQDTIMAAVHSERNVVTEMVATLSPVKPIRSQDSSLQIDPKIWLSFK